MPEPRGNGSVPPLRVLVVDDDVVVPMSLSLDLADFEILEATRFNTGLEDAVRLQPDAVLVDLRLPDGHGLELVRRLRVTHATRQLPIVVLTAAHDPADEVKVLRAGADAYLAKPQEPAQIAAVIRHVCGVPGHELRARRQALIDGRPVEPIAPPERAPRPSRFRRR